MKSTLCLKTNIEKLQGEIPTTIALNKQKTTIGRRSASCPNDVVLSVSIILAIIYVIKY